MAPLCKGSCQPVRLTEGLSSPGFGGPTTIPPSRLSPSHLPLHKGGFEIALCFSERSRSFGSHERGRCPHRPGWGCGGCRGTLGTAVPTPFVPSGHFPLTGGIGPRGWKAKAKPSPFQGEGAPVLTLGRMRVSPVQGAPVQGLSNSSLLPPHSYLLTPHSPTPGAGPTPSGWHSGRPPRRRPGGPEGEQRGR